MNYQIIHDNVIDWAKSYDGPPFHAMFGDPPYHLTSIVKRFGKKDSAPAQYGDDGAFSRASQGFMGATWDGGELAFDPETWYQLGRHLYPGGWGMMFASSRGWHRMAVAIEDAGMIIHPTIFLWCQSQGMPKATRAQIKDNQIDEIVNIWYDKIWKNTLSNNVNTATKIYLKSQIEVGTYIQKNDFVVDNVVDYLESKDQSLHVNIVESLFIEQLDTLENIYIVVVDVTQNQEQVFTNAINVVLNLKDGNRQLEKIKIIFVPLIVQINSCRKIEVKIMGEEAQKIELGGLKFLSKTITDVQCAEVVKSLKRTILNLLKSSQNCDMNYRMEQLFAMNVIITKSIMERLITFMANIVNKNWETHRYGAQALKPVVEPIIVFQRPYDGRPIENMMETGAGALNIDGTRLGFENQKDFERAQFGQQTDIKGNAYNTNRPSDGKVFAENVPANPSGRWPTNFSLQHHPECEIVGHEKSDSYVVNRFTDDAKPFGDAKGEEYESVEIGGGDKPVYACHEDCVVRKLDEQTGTLKSGKVKQEYSRKNDGGYHGSYGDIPLSGYGDSGGASRFFYQADWSLNILEQLELTEPLFYCPKTSVQEREAGMDDVDPIQYWSDGRKKTADHPKQRGKTGRRNPHPTLKPISLTKYLATMLLPPNIYSPDRRIMVPFAGAGSEMIGALLAGWDQTIGIELTEEYIPIAEKRLKFWSGWSAQSTNPKEILKLSKKEQKDLSKESDSNSNSSKRTTLF